MQSATILAFRNWLRKRNPKIESRRSVATQFELSSYFRRRYTLSVTNGGSGDVADMTVREFARGQRLFGRYTLLKILGGEGGFALQMILSWSAHREPGTH